MPALVKVQVAATNSFDRNAQDVLSRLATKKSDGRGCLASGAVRGGSPEEESEL